MKSITEFTLIPLSFVGILIGGIFWLTSLYAKVEAHSEQISTVKAKQEKINDVLQVIKEDVSVIKYQVMKRK